MLLYNNLLLREINKLGEQQMLILTDRLFISAVVDCVSFRGGGGSICQPLEFPLLRTFLHIT